jgi:hypothetical protein
MMACGVAITAERVGSQRLVEQRAFTYRIFGNLLHGDGG